MDFWTTFFKKYVPIILIVMGFTIVFKEMAVQENVLGGVLTATPSLFEYPLTANTNLKKLEWVYRAEEVLREEHNRLGAELRAGTLPPYQWNDYLNARFTEKSRLLGAEKARLRDALGYSAIDRTPTTTAELYRQNTEKESFKKSKKWDITTDKIIKKNVASAATEDFTTYTETDPTSKITVTAAKVDVAAIAEETTAYVSKDYTSAHFAGDFTHYVEVYQNSSTVTGIASVVWGLSNSSFITVAGTNPVGTTINHHLRMYEETASAASLFLGAYNGSTVTDTNLTLSLNTPYYLTVVRDEAVGSFGTLYCYIYSDSGRTTLVDTLTVTIPTAKTDFQYLTAFGNWGSAAGSYTWTGYIQNLDLNEATAVETIIHQDVLQF